MRGVSSTARSPSTLWVETSAYAYFDNTNDRRLQTIHHKYPNGSTLSRFDYAYDTAGNILTWRKQADAEAMLWRYGYDEADQLTSAIKQATDPPQTVLQRFGYAYDRGGNRTVEQIDDQVTGATHDSLNRLVSQQPSGAMLFAGTVSEPATVAVQGVPATVTAGNQFRASVPVGSGTNTVSVAATDATGNTATQQYEVDNLGTARTFTYDANGNLTADTGESVRRRFANAIARAIRAHDNSGSTSRRSGHEPGRNTRQSSLSAFGRLASSVCSVA